jgi:cobalt-zinc-cadmium resistance protein CzcA
MIDRIIQFSIKWRVFVVLLTVLLIGIGLQSASELPIDAVPDVTTDQVQINTDAPAFTPLEIEQYVTVPIELAMSSLPRKQEIRSISKFGLSQVTVIFDEGTDIYWARQLVLERLLEVRDDLPAGIAPEMAPVSTGLGEIYQFAVESDGSGENPHSLADLRTILDWTIKPQLRTVPGVIEVNSFGGQEKQYEVLLDPNKLIGYRVTLKDIFEALERNNANVGGAYIEKHGEQQLIRGVGLLRNTRDIENVVIASRQGTPVYVRDVGTVGLGSQVRQGAATIDGRGETVIGMAMLLKGENSRTVAQAVAQKLDEVKSALPPGVTVRTFLDRRELVNKTINTAGKNLLEGGLLVMLILFLFLLQLRAGLIVSSAIPLSMLIAIIGMKYLGISANLMSLGAIDFGLIVDAAVIIVENCVRRLALRRHELGRPLTNDERIDTIFHGTVEVRRASQYGEIIIIAAYIPILSLVGIEGKMFRPMAFTVILALSGALILSLTLIPALCAMFLREPKVRGKSASSSVSSDEDHSDAISRFLRRFYEPSLRTTLRFGYVTIAAAAIFVVACIGSGLLLGSEFLPKLDEGALAVNLVRLPSVSLNTAIEMTTTVEKTLKEFPEVTNVVSRIGRPEIATDPMGTDMGDTYVILKPKAEWQSASSRDELVSIMAERLEKIPGMAFSFSQPIEFRMMELIEGIGARSDVVIKIFGDDMSVLEENAQRTAGVIQKVSGATDVKVQQVSGLPMLEINLDREAIARYGIDGSDVQDVIRTAVAGSETTKILEGSRRFALVTRLAPWARNSPEAFSNLTITTPEGGQVPLKEVARIRGEQGPAVVSRENGQRLITVEANVRGRDIGTFVAEAKDKVAAEVHLPPSYLMQWGGLWEHLESGRNRLLLIVPVTFFLIFLLLFTTFNSLKQAVFVFTGIPFAVTGGVLALLIRNMNFSMSAGIGFIAVSGVAVLNGVVMLAFINQLRENGLPLENAILQGALTRLRPVLMTALVASLGFVPMALSTSSGAEVQRPLATVVIGGLITSTLLTLFVLPAIVSKFSRSRG